MLQTTQISADPFSPQLGLEERLLEDKTRVFAADRTRVFAAEPPRPRSEKHQAIVFWEYKTYKPFGKNGAKRHLGQSPEKVDRYLERLDGTTISRTEYGRLRDVFQRHVNTLVQHGVAAARWTALNQEAYGYICRGMKKAFDGFDFCDDGHWKVNLFGTLVYPDMIRDRGAAATNGDTKKRASTTALADDEPQGKRAKLAPPTAITAPPGACTRVSFYYTNYSYHACRPRGSHVQRA